MSILHAPGLSAEQLPDIEAALAETSADAAYATETKPWPGWEPGW